MAKLPLYFDSDEFYTLLHKLLLNFATFVQVFVAVKQFFSAAAAKQTASIGHLP